MSASLSGDCVIVVGGGIAGYSAATRLRALGFAGPIDLVDRELSSYDRPPLSKDLFSPGFGLDGLSFATTDELAQQGITTHFGCSVISLESDDLSITFDNGTTLRGSAVVLATGGVPRTLSIPGADLQGVFSLRTFSDAEALRSAAKPNSHVMIVGAGLIGAELASSLNAAGVDTTLIEPAERPLSRAVGDVLAEYLHSMHAAHGVNVIQAAPISIEEEGDNLAVVLDSGQRLTGNAVVLSVGIVPDTSLAEMAGLEVDNGVIVDERYQTSALGVFCIGDVARTRREGELLQRHEHWEAAKLAGEAVAHSIMGLDPPETGASWFWSDRYGIHLESVGRLTGSGETIVRPTEPHPTFFLLDEGRLAGAASINDSQIVRAARRIIDRNIPVSREELADPSTSLREVLRRN